MNELIITVSMRIEKHCNSSVDTSKRVSENRKIVRPANDGTQQYTNLQASTGPSILRVVARW